MAVGNMLIKSSVLSIIIYFRLVYCQYHLYWTDIINENDLQIHYYCLHRYELFAQRVFEIVPYCFRSKNGQEQSLNERFIHGNSTTFGQLKMKGTTSGQLYTWQAPIDLIERYKRYMGNPIELL